MLVDQVWMPERVDLLVVGGGMAGCDVYGAALDLALQSDSRWGPKVGPLSPRAEEELVEEALARFGETTVDLSMNFSGALEDETIVGYEDYELPQPRQT
jgi:hypothetical protein